MFSKLVPDFYYHSLEEITPSMLHSLGIEALVMDIDNTIVTYDDPLPTESADRWFSDVTEAGIKISFVSNNNRERVDLFNSRLGYPAYAKSGKPFTKYILTAVADMGVIPEKTALIGDQIFTDTLGGNLYGVKTVLLDPIKPESSARFKFKRKLERAVYKIYNIKNTEV